MAAFRVAALFEAPNPCAENDILRIDEAAELVTDGDTLSMCLRGEVIMFELQVDGFGDAHLPLGEVA
ncbi:hypothetical protein TRIP_E190246 [uncultured Spirochaetota bacterium]|uniref:Uncharacterized protein n=1 Tax=uncultured Spirochaetota bacterium TaxID=460511 RepID=A0A652ZU69_9SPIR|nr:hypothetical protein TRIP_E190246 [uncultured Spirochaetota bacterium]